MLTVKQLRTIAAVHENQTFKEAADALCVTPSALTKTLNDIEGLLDARIVDRDARELTNLGLVLLSNGKGALDSIARGVEQVQAMQGTRRYEVFITAPLLLSHLAQQPLIKFVTPFRRASDDPLGPRRHFKIEIREPFSCTKKFLEGQCDVLFTYAEEEWRLPSDTPRILFPFPPLGTFVHQSHDLAGKTVTMRETIPYPHATGRMPIWFDQWYRGNFAWMRYGQENPYLLQGVYPITSDLHRVITNDWSTVHYLTSSCQAIGVATTRYVEHIIKNDLFSPITIIDAPGLPEGKKVLLAWKPDSALNVQFVEELKKTLVETLGLSETE